MQFVCSTHHFDTFFFPKPQQDSIFHNFYLRRTKNTLEIIKLFFFLTPDLYFEIFQIFYN